jgi:hypothetical protein
LLVHIFPFLFCAVFDPWLTSNPAHIFVSGYFNPVRCSNFCVSHSNLPLDFLFCFNPATPSSMRPFFCPTVASNFYSSWDSAHLTFGPGLLILKLVLNMSCDDLTTPVAAAATAQVKLCPYNEEEPHIWFRLIKAQFAAAGNKLQKL